MSPSGRRPRILTEAVLPLLFNLAMGVVDLLLLRSLRRECSTTRALLTLVLALLAVIAVASLGEVYARAFTLFGTLFTFLGLLAWGLFLHLPILALSAAALLRREARRTSRTLVGASLFTWLFALYAFGIEPTWLEITRYEVVSPKIQERLRVVVIADLQTDRIGDYERRAIQAALDEKPDLLLLPGDYLHTKSEEEFRELRVQLVELLRELDFRAPLGVLAVRGNVDHNEWETLFADIVGAHCFPESGAVDLGWLHVTALDLQDSFRSDLAVEPAEAFHIVFGHGPDFALGDVQAELLIAGHTHGGQVRLPFYGPPITLSRVPRDWAAGRTELEGGRTLIVSRGVGMERGYAPRLRFGCRPEVVVVDLVPGK